MISGHEKRSSKDGAGAITLAARVTVSSCRWSASFHAATLACSDCCGSRSRRGEQSNIAQDILAQDEAHVDVARKVVLGLDLHGMLQL
jgi:hypothetical protein